MALKKIYPQYSYLIKVKDPENVRKYSNRKYSTISSISQISQKRNSSTDGNSFFFNIVIYINYESYSLILLYKKK